MLPGTAQSRFTVYLNICVYNKTTSTVLVLFVPGIATIEFLSCIFSYIHTSYPILEFGYEFRSPVRIRHYDTKSLLFWNSHSTATTTKGPILYVQCADPLAHVARLPDVTKRIGRHRAYGHDAPIFLVCSPLLGIIESFVNEFVVRIALPRLQLDFGLSWFRTTPVLSISFPSPSTPNRPPIDPQSSPI